MKQGSSLQIFAKELRNHSTEAEPRLWRYLRNCQLEGVKFRRQQPIETYIVDFISFEKRIVIELDGRQHAENKGHDEQRDACLRRNGFAVLRFWNNEIFESIEGALEVIRQAWTMTVTKLQI